MNKLKQFLTHMEGKRTRAIAVTLALFIVVGLLIVLGREMVNRDSLNKLMQAISESPFALPATIALFVGFAFFGVPQWVLMTASLLAFGPVTGSIYSWIATMVSASFDFYLGKLVGAKRLRRFGGDFINRFTAFIRKNGLITSMAVRFVPTGPFVLVNMAAGVSGMKFIYFFIGTGLGIIPKILAVGSFGGIIKAIRSGEGWLYVLLLAGILIFWIIIMLIARKRLQSAVPEEDTENNPKNRT